jgi:hypothetical protein
MSRSDEEIRSINLEKRQCALCGSIIYEDDSGWIEKNGALFCTRSCMEEATFAE